MFWIAGEQDIILHKERNDPNTLCVTAGLSIGAGFIRIFSPESKQFLEAKKAGQRNTSAVEFWKETKIMLAKEWRICVYRIIPMTLVSFKQDMTLVPRIII